MTEFSLGSPGLDLEAIKGYPYQVPVYEHTLDGEPDIYRWCDENIGQFIIDWNYDIMPEGGMNSPNKVFIFRKKDDAALFKLTWG